MHDDASGTECADIRLLLTFLLHDQYPDCKVDITSYNLPMLAPRAPKQRNAVDCGVFTLGFTRLIMNHFDQLHICAGTAREAAADAAFGFLEREVDSITSLRPRIKMLIAQIAGSARASDLFAVEEEETSDVECVEVRLAKGKSTTSMKLSTTTAVESTSSAKSTTSSGKSTISSAKSTTSLKPPSMKIPTTSSSQSSSTSSHKPTTSHKPIIPSKPPAPLALPNRNPSEPPTRRSSYFETHARTQDPPKPATSYKNSLTSMLQSFKRQADPISALKPEASLYGDAKRDHDWHSSEKTTKEQKAKKRKGLDYVPQNTL